MRTPIFDRSETCQWAYQKWIKFRLEVHQGVPAGSCINRQWKENLKSKREATACAAASATLDMTKFTLQTVLSVGQETETDSSGTATWERSV